MKKLTTPLAIIAIAATTALSGCISVEREVEPTTTTTTSRSTPSLLTPSTTTVERTTTY